MAWGNYRGSYSERIEREATEYANRKQKSGRVRHVWDDDMVAHLWANQSQSEARNKQGNFYFTGATIFSYGGHFPIARHVERKGERVILFTTRDYSHTTSKHKRVAQGACRHLKVIYAFNILGSTTNKSDEDHQKNLDQWDRDIVELVGKTAKARTRAGEYSGILNALVENANEYCRFFGLRRRFEVPATTREEMNRLIAENKKREEARLKRERAARLKREAKQREKDADDRAAWLTGTGNYYPYSWRMNSGGAELRIKGDVIQTSFGAEVPLKHALKILPLIRSGKEYKRNGHTIHLGHFALDEINEKGDIVAGCHTIKRAEIERLAATIGA